MSIPSRVRPPTTVRSLRTTSAPIVMSTKAPISRSIPAPMTRSVTRDNQHRMSNSKVPTSTIPLPSTPNGNFSRLKRPTRLPRQQVVEDNPAEEMPACMTESNYIQPTQDFSPQEIPPSMVRSMISRIPDYRSFSLHEKLAPVIVSDPSVDGMKDSDEAELSDCDSIEEALNEKERSSNGAEQFRNSKDPVNGHANQMNAQHLPKDLTQQAENTLNSSDNNLLDQSLDFHRPAPATDAKIDSSSSDHQMETISECDVGTKETRVTRNGGMDLDAEEFPALLASSSVMNMSVEDDIKGSNQDEGLTNQKSSQLSPRRGSVASSQHSSSSITTGDSSKKRPRSPTPSSKLESTPPKRSLKQQTSAGGNGIRGPTTGGRRATESSVLSAAGGKSIARRASTTKPASTTTATTTKPRATKPPQAEANSPRSSVSSTATPARTSGAAQTSSRPSGTSSVSKTTGAANKPSTVSPRTKITPDKTTQGPQSGKVATTAAGGSKSRDTAAKQPPRNATSSSTRPGTLPQSKDGTGKPSVASTSAKESETKNITRRSSIQSVTSSTTTPTKSSSGQRARAGSLAMVVSPSSSSTSKKSLVTKRSAAPSNQSCPPPSPTPSSLPDLTLQLDSQRLLISQQESRLLELDAIASSQTLHLSRARKNLSGAVIGFDVMAVVCGRLSDKLANCKVDELHRDLNEARARFSELQCQMDELQTRKERLIAELMEQTTNHEQELSLAENEHNRQLRDIEVTLAGQKDSAIRQILDQHSEEVVELRDAHGKQLEELAGQYETIMRQLSQKNHDDIEELKKRDSKHIEELQNRHSEKMKEMTVRFDEMKVNFTEKMELLQQECLDLRSRSQTQDDLVQRQSSQKLQPSQSPPSPLESTRASPNPLPPGTKANNMPAAMTTSCYTPSSGATLIRGQSFRLSRDDSSVDGCTMIDSSVLSQLQISLNKAPTSPRAIPRSPLSPRTPRSPLSPMCSPRSPRSAAGGSIASFMTTSSTSIDEMAQLQATLAEYQHLPDEIQSLKVVLEMKNEEITELRKQNMELEQQILELKETKKKAAQLQYKIENLEAIINLKSDGEKQLQDRYQLLFRKLDQESKEKKRLTREYDELQYRVQEAEFHDQVQREEDGEEGEMPSSMTTSVVMRGRTSGSGRHVKLHKGIEHDRSKRRTLASSRELRLED